MSPHEAMHGVQRRSRKLVDDEPVMPAPPAAIQDALGHDGD